MRFIKLVAAFCWCPSTTSLSLRSDVSSPGCGGDVSPGSSTQTTGQNKRKNKGKGKGKAHNHDTTSNSATQTHADAGTSRGKFDAIRAEYSVEDVKIITNAQSLSMHIHELLSSDLSKLEDDEIGDLKNRLEGLQKEFFANFEKVDGDEDSGWVEEKIHHESFMVLARCEKIFEKLFFRAKITKFLRTKY